MSESAGGFSHVTVQPQVQWAISTSLETIRNGLWEVKDNPRQSWNKWLVQVAHRKAERCFFLLPCSPPLVNSVYHVGIRVRHSWSEEIGDNLVQSPLLLCLFPHSPPWWPEQVMGLVKSLAACLGKCFGCALEFWLKVNCVLERTGYPQIWPKDHTLPILLTFWTFLHPGFLS